MWGTKAKRKTLRPGRTWRLAKEAQNYISYIRDELSELRRRAYNQSMFIGLLLSRVRVDAVDLDDGRTLGKIGSDNDLYLTLSLSERG